MQGCQRVRFGRIYTNLNIVEMLHYVGHKKYDFLAGANTFTMNIDIFERSSPFSMLFTCQTGLGRPLLRFRPNSAKPARLIGRGRRPAALTNENAQYSRRP